MLAPDAGGSDNNGLDQCAHERTTPPILCGQELSHLTEHSSATRFETSQLMIFEGGETVLETSTSFLTFLAEQTSVKRSSWILAMRRSRL